jgi:hypothetical protein
MELRLFWSKEDAKSTLLIGGEVGAGLKAFTVKVIFI